MVQMTLPTNYEMTRNQNNVCLNACQGDATKVLCVCSAGVLRSPTMANVLNQTFGYNTRAVGTIIGFALIPLTEALICWADEIVFVDFDTYDALDVVIKEDITEYGCKITYLNIPDDYDYNDPILKDIIIQQYAASQ